MRKVLAELSERNENYEKLFYELMRLRSLCINDYDFNLVLTKEIYRKANHKALIALVNHVYNKFKNKQCVLDLNLLSGMKISPICLFAGILKHSDLATNQFFRQGMMTYIRKNLPHFDVQLNRCFVSTSDLHKVDVGKSMG